MVDVSNPEELRDWLEDKPIEWSQVIAARAALRAIPYAVARSARDDASRLPLAVFRATAISWAARNDPAHDMVAAASAAASAAARAAASAANAADAAANIANTAYAANAAANTANIANTANTAAFCRAVSADCNWLAAQSDAARAPRALSNRSLWQGKPPPVWGVDWAAAAGTLEHFDPNYSFWTDWFERRIRGERSAFDIPGDKRRKEDKWLLRQIADARDEDFWDKGKGAEYVNGRLTEWLEDARKRAAKNLDKPPPPGPDAPDFHIAPEPDRRAYGPNDEGILDRLPPDQQDQLRDSPNQRRSYQHIRDDIEELLGEGQRCGDKLLKLLRNALRDFPEDFANAEADLVWRHIEKLRRIYRKHLAAAQSLDPDPNKLEPQIAIDLDGVLGLMNNYVLGDQGLVRRQENSVDPRLRADRAEEAKAAEPIVEALTNSEHVATEAVKDDLRRGKADLEDALPDAEAGDPSADAEVDAINGERRNITAGLLTAAKETAKDVKSGAAKEADKQSLEFVQKNSPAIMDYVRKAFSPETAKGVGDWLASLVGMGGG
ncbi:MAG: hypothetical protein AAFQ13_00235 [Pseudomonadota bacterium]